MDNFLIAKATDVGMTRQVNEDSMTVFDSPNGQVLVVCDGMGGQAAGDVASQLAINIIENILTDNTFETPEEAIRRSVLAANQGVLNRTVQNPELEGMGSTCVMLIIKNGRVHCGWVGDSRIYYIANHTIRQISHDQSYVQQLVDSGQLTQAEAANHPQKNEITNCIGLQGMTAPDIVAVPIVPEQGSVFLLCSDGLSGMVDESRIERVISNSTMTLQQKADKLIALANEAGGLDNITVELVQFGTSDVAGATSGTLFETPESIKKPRKRRKSYMMFCVVISLIVLLLGGSGYYCAQIGKEKKKTEPKTENKVNGGGKPSGTVAPTNNVTQTSESEKTTGQNPKQNTTPKEEKGTGVSDVVDKKKKGGNTNRNSIIKQVDKAKDDSLGKVVVPQNVPEVLQEKYK